MMIFKKLNPFKKKTFNIYCIYINDKTNHKHLLKEFNKEFEAKNSLRYTIEERLKELSPKAKNDIELLEVYFNSRKYIYKIENDDFSEDDYVKEISPRVYSQFIDNVIDGGFKKFNKKEELSLLNNIENSKVISINEKDKFIEIVYEKENEKKYLTIEQTSHYSSREGAAGFYIFDNKKLEDTKPSIRFNDISKIIKVFHLVKFNDYDIIFRKDILEILYKNSDNKINSYRLTLSFDFDDGIDLSIQKYENIFSFKTRVLDDKDRTELNYYYDDKYFTPEFFYDNEKKIVDKDSPTLIKRERAGYYDANNPCPNFEGKVYFVQEKESISAYNLTYSHLMNPFSLPNKDIYNCLNEEEKNKLRHFFAIAQLYINDLYVNREFNNIFTLDGLANSKEDEKIDKLINILEDSDWIKECYYDNAEHGHAPSMLVNIYYKEKNKNKKFVVFNNWIDFKTIVKYSDYVKEEVEELLKDIM